MIWTFMSPDARHAHREVPQFLSALRDAGLRESDIVAAQGTYSTLVGEVVRQAPGPILLSVERAHDRVVLSVEDLGPSRAEIGVAHATMTARAAIGMRVDVDLGSTSSTHSLERIAESNDRRSNFARWEVARWIDEHAAEVVNRTLAAAAADMGTLFSEESAAARHLNVSFRHLGNAIALGDIDLYLNEVRWLLASSAAGYFDIQGMFAALRRALSYVQTQLPEHAAHLLEPMIERMREIEPAAVDVSHLQTALAERYFAAFSFGEDSVETFLDEALSLGLSRRALFLDMLQQAQRETGRRWQIGELSIADEAHRTATAMRLMTMLRASTPKTIRHGVLFGATAPGETHHVGLQMVCDLAHVDGWEIAMAVPGIAGDQLVDAIEAARPDVIAISASLSVHVAGLIGVIAEIRRRPNLAHAAIVVGGTPFATFPQLCSLVDADAFALDAADAVELLRSFSRGTKRVLQSLRANSERRS